CREVASALAIRAMLRVGEGKLDEAWQDLLACHRLGRLVARGATLIEGLVGIALEHVASAADLAYLERANLTAKQFQDRLKDLQGLPAMPLMADPVDVGERIMYLDTLEVIRRRGSAFLEQLAPRMEGPAGGPPKKPKAEELKALAMIDWEPALRNGNRWYDRMVGALRLKDRADREKALEKIDQDLKRLAASPKNLAKLFQGKDAPDKMFGKVIGDF